MNENPTPTSTDEEREEPMFTSLANIDQSLTDMEDAFAEFIEQLQEADAPEALYALSSLMTNDANLLLHSRGVITGTKPGLFGMFEEEVEEANMPLRKYGTLCATVKRLQLLHQLLDIVAEKVAPVRDDSRAAAVAEDAEQTTTTTTTTTPAE